MDIVRLVVLGTVTIAYGVKSQFTRGSSPNFEDKFGLTLRALWHINATRVGLGYK